MLTKTGHVNAIDGKKIFLRQWQTSHNSGKKKAIVHIIHGLAEHCGRYNHVATRLSEAGYIVGCHDHRGHGVTAASSNELGHFADKYGWQLVISDTLAVNQHLRELYPKTPIIALGHSIGAFIVQKFMIDHPGKVDACILSAPTFTHPLLARTARLITIMEKLRLGKRKESRLINALVFGAYNRAFQGRTPFDWLSSNPRIADAYMSDPKCGFIGTVQLWQDLLDGISELYKSDTLDRLPKHIPYYVMAGAQDPVSSFSIGVKKLLQKLQSVGIMQLTYRIYPEGRHEMFNELNQDEVFEDLIGWLDQVCESCFKISNAA